MSGLPNAVARSIVAPLYRSLVPVAAAVEATGTLRRRAERIDHLELLVLPRLGPDGRPDWGAITGAVAAWAGRPVRDTPHGIVHQAPSGHEIQVAIHEDPDTWGIELLRRTGPAAFVMGLGATLRAQGYQLRLPARPLSAMTPILTGPTGLSVHVADEATLFRLADLPVVPPPERDHYRFPDHTASPTASP